jgi:hypothetical protein
MTAPNPQAARAGAVLEWHFAKKSDPWRPMQSRTFKTAEQYLRALHPDLCFVFNITEAGIGEWKYSLEFACELQSSIVALACTHAKELDKQKGLFIIIEDESCSIQASSAAMTHAPRNPMG